jgi:branched-chain amino acid transport system substrate-binding protein
MSSSRILVPLGLSLVMLSTACGNRQPLEQATLQTGGTGTTTGTGTATGSDGTGGTTGVGVTGGTTGVGVTGSTTGAGTVGATGTTTGSASGAAPGGRSGGAQGATTTGGSSSGGSAPAGPKHYDQGASDTAIKFGSVSSLTGLFTDFMQPRGARAFFKYINSLGGVNGRQLSLLIYDDQYDVTRNAALTRQAFESDKVFAFVANEAALTAHGGRAYVEANNIPVIGGDLIDASSWGKSPMYYPQSYLESAAGGRLAGRFAASLGCKRVAGMSLAVDESRGWTKSFEQGLKDGGISGGYTYSADVSFAETDYTAYVANMKSENVDCATFGAQTTNFVRFQRAFDQQNYHPKQILPSSAYDPVYAKEAAPGNEGTYSMVQYDIFENAKSNPAVKLFLDQSAKWEPGMKQSGYAILAWVAGEIAVEAVRHMGNNITRQNLIDSLNSLTNFKTGIVPPISFTSGPHTGLNCGNVIRRTGGTWVVVKAKICL